MQAATLDRTPEDAQAEKAALEHTLMHHFAAIPAAPRSAFQMFAQDQLDQLEQRGPLPPDIDAEKMQQQFVMDFNALDAEQQAAYAARGRDQFQELLQAAREGLCEVLSVVCSRCHILNTGRRHPPADGLYCVSQMCK